MEEIISEIWYEAENSFPIVLFDGVCNLCNASVDFIVKRERNNKLRFASLQSELGQQIITKYVDGEAPDSILFLEDGKLYTQSTAALRVSTYLKFPWCLIGFLRIFPSKLRDYVYNFIAANRYKWFGKKETCRLPTEEERKKFLG